MRSISTLPTQARFAATTIVTAGVILVSAACGGGSPPARTAGSASFTGSTESQQLAFSQCMRSTGVSRFPDPGSGGVIPKESAQQLGVTEARFQATYNSCKHLLPNGGNGPNQAEIQHVRAEALRFSQCMRTHGVSLPDPDSSGRIPDPASAGVDQGSPQFQAANQACEQYRPPYIPSNAAYNSWARTHGA